MKEYDPKAIEPKWQKFWDENKLNEAEEKSHKPKYYTLVEFPYPSAEGLHVGHPRPYIGMDVVSRKRRMEGYNVLFPIGWDAFGLPAENYAIKTRRKPAEIIKENSDRFREQIKNIGISFDWSREVNTTDPEYYRWTQWLFLRFLEKGLAYKAKMMINWCPKDKIGLANEEVIDGKCERCGTPVEKREKEQWMLKITAYADRLDKDLDLVDYPERVKTQQRNWIGRSNGAEISFELKSENQQLEAIKVFTTRPDTIFGATYLVLAPEHQFIKDNESRIKNYNEVQKYIDEIRNKEDIERTAEGKEKTGVELKGIKAINPATKEEIPVWIADYVLPHYGTGAIMAVPAHDERDFEFAKKFGLPVRYVVAPKMIDNTNPHVEGKEIVFREGIMAIVRNPKDGKVINLKWKKQPWTTFVMGGLENGEDIVEAAKREIYEETGYKNLKFLKLLGGPSYTEFFAAHKDVNRLALTWQILFELEDEDKDQLSEEESVIHEVTWVDPDTLKPEDLSHAEAGLVLERLREGERVFTDTGLLLNSGTFNRSDSESVKKEIIEAVGGKDKISFKLRDWVFSRQRYWGEPIPVIHCEKCGVVPVPDKDLPVRLPEVDKYEPTDNGESPLASIASFVDTECPQCGGPGRRETDTMPNWAGSSWYFLRYTDPNNDKEFASKDNLDHWMQVDWYNGGMEHTTLHLLYSRFWNKFLFDIGLVPTTEPYAKRTSHGLILAEGGAKMSKSVGNVVNPDSIVERFGADTLRLYEMFMGPFEQAIAWSEDALVGPRRFIERVWKLQNKISESDNLDLKDEILFNQTIKKVSTDIEMLGFNTAVSSLMIFTNALEKRESVSKREYETLILLLVPFVPHLSEELWEALGHDRSVTLEPWPKFDEQKLANEEMTMAVQINGKSRATFQAPSNALEEELVFLAKNLPEVKKWLNGAEPQRVIVVVGRIVNLVL